MRKRFLTSVGAVALSAAFASVAFAADMPAPQPVYTKAPPPLMNWSGFYAGAHVGWGRARFSGTWIDDSSDNFYPWRTRPSGILGGVHLGHNWQMNTFVYGWEADVSGMSWKKTVTGFYNTSDSITTKLSLLASLRGRLGVTLSPSTHVYVTGGLAYANARVSALQPTSGNTGSAKFNSFGGVVGAGAEWKQTQNVSWRLEGLWYIFDKSKTFLVGPPATLQSVDAKFKDVIVVRGGVTWHY